LRAHLKLYNSNRPRHGVPTPHEYRRPTHTQHVRNNRGRNATSLTQTCDRTPLRRRHAVPSHKQLALTLTIELFICCGKDARVRPVGDASSSMSGVLGDHVPSPKSPRRPDQLYSPPHPSQAAEGLAPPAYPASTSAFGMDGERGQGKGQGWAAAGAAATPLHDAPPQQPGQHSPAVDTSQPVQPQAVSAATAVPTPATAFRPMQSSSASAVATSTTAGPLGGGAVSSQSQSVPTTPQHHQHAGPSSASGHSSTPSQHRAASPSGDHRKSWAGWMEHKIKVAKQVIQERMGSAEPTADTVRLPLPLSLPPPPPPPLHTRLVAIPLLTLPTSHTHTHTHTRAHRRWKSGCRCFERRRRLTATSFD
jgi:hypothetical protein